MKRRVRVCQRFIVSNFQIKINQIHILSFTSARNFISVSFSQRLSYRITVTWTDLRIIFRHSFNFQIIFHPSIQKQQLQNPHLLFSLPETQQLINYNRKIQNFLKIFLDYFVSITNLNASKLQIINLNNIYSGSLPIFHQNCSIIYLLINYGSLQQQLEKIIQMLAQSKMRRTAGFIRVNSSKALLTKTIQPSSDEFSSFEKDKLNEEAERQFSPYRHHLQKKMNRPPMPNKTVKQDEEIVQMFSNDKLTNNYLDNNFIQNTRSRRGSKGKIVSREQIKEERRNSKKKEFIQRELESIEKICSQIYQKHNTIPNIKSSSQQIYLQKLSPVKRQQKQPENPLFFGQTLKQNQKQYPSKIKNHSQFSFQDSSLQMSCQNLNTLNYERHQEVVKQQKYQEFEYQIKKSSKFDFQQSSVSDDNEDSQSYFFDGTFKKKNAFLAQQRVKMEKVSFGERIEHNLRTNTFENQKQGLDLLKIEHNRARNRFISQNNDEIQSQNDGQDLIMEYPVEQFKKTTLKECVQAVQGMKPSLQQKQGLYRTKGGICFDLDVNQFAQTKVQEKPKITQAVQKKPKKVNSKQQILKRRQNARNYDKGARAKVFGGY